MQINENSRITLHFSIKLDDGTVIDTNFEKPAASFVFGDGSMLPGFESKLVGLGVGQAGSFTIAAADAFGTWDDTKQMDFKKDQFKDYDLNPGLVISFGDAAATERPGVVKEVSDENVVIDFNHPLAGRDLQFDVSIVDVQLKD